MQVQPYTEAIFTSMSATSYEAGVDALGSKIKYNCTKVCPSSVGRASRPPLEFKGRLGRPSADMTQKQYQDRAQAAILVFAFYESA